MPPQPPDQPDQPEPPMLRVVSGDATAQELAALVTVLATHAGGTPPGMDDESPVDLWSAGSALRGTRSRPPAGTALGPPSQLWRTSLWPR